MTPKRRAELRERVRAAEPYLVVVSSTDLAELLDATEADAEVARVVEELREVWLGDPGNALAAVREFVPAGGKPGPVLFTTIRLVPVAGAKFRLMPAVVPLAV